MRNRKGKRLLFQRDTVRRLDVAELRIVAAASLRTAMECSSVTIYSNCCGSAIHECTLHTCDGNPTLCQGD